MKSYLLFLLVQLFVAGVSLLKASLCLFLSGFGLRY